MNSNHCACSQASPGSRHALSFFLCVYIACCCTLYVCSLLQRGCSRQLRVRGRMKHHVAYGDRRHTTRGAKMTPFFSFFFFWFPASLRLSCLDSSCDALSGHEMNSQVWLNNKELQSAAALHPRVLGLDIKRFIAVTLSQMKKGRIFLTARHLRKVPWNQSPAAALRFRGDVASSRHNNHCANFTQSLWFPSHRLVIALETAQSKASPRWTVKWNLADGFPTPQPKQGEKQSKYILQSLIYWLSTVASL